MQVVAGRCAVPARPLRRPPAGLAARGLCQAVALGRAGGADAASIPAVGAVGGQALEAGGGLAALAPAKLAGTARPRALVAVGAVRGARLACRGSGQGVGVVRGRHARTRREAPAAPAGGGWAAPCARRFRLIAGLPGLLPTPSSGSQHARQPRGCSPSAVGQAATRQQSSRAAWRRAMVTAVWLGVADRWERQARRVRTKHGTGAPQKVAVVRGASTAGPQAVHWPAQAQR